MKTPAASKPLSGAAHLAQRQMLQQAVDLLRDKMHAEAEPVLLSILQRWPGQPDALHFLGVLEHTRCLLYTSDAADE